MCKSHAKQIDDMQKQIVHATQSRHKNAGEISVLKARHEDTCEDIEQIQEDLKTIKENHISHIEADMASLKTNVGWLKERYEKLDKKFWALLMLTLATLIGIVVNTYLTLK